MAIAISIDLFGLISNSKYNFENAYFLFVALKMQQNEKKMTKCKKKKKILGM